MKKLMVVALAAAFGLSLAGQASAAGDRTMVAEGPSGAGAVGTAPTGGVASPRSAGEPAAATDRKADDRRCEAMTGTERETCMRDARAPSGATTGATGSAVGTTGSATSGATTSPSGSVVTPGGSGKTGTTAGPGESSPNTAPGSASATKPDTSGSGKAQ